MSKEKKEASAVVDKALSNFFTTTCFRDTKCGIRDTFNIVTCALSDYDPEYVYRLSGSISEFHIDPVMPCYGDIDIMKTATRMLAIPEGITLTSAYPDHLQDDVEVYDMCDCDQKGYVLLKFSASFKREKKTYQRLQCRPSTTSEGSLLRNAALHEKNQIVSQVVKMIAGSGEKHWVSGPASVLLLNLNDLLRTNLYFCATKEDNTIDDVPCITCPVWPPQAAGWGTRYREHGWPDQVTIGLVLSNGCDVVGATHRRSREDEFMRTFQWRLSFSRAETLLLNTWTPVQQIVYHMLRFLGKTALLTHACNNDDHNIKLLHNYHIKTLMLWSCELQPERWWQPDRLLGICSQLLKTLVSWLKIDRCRNFFIPECNLFDFRLDEIRATLLFSHLESFTVDQLGRWFVVNYGSSVFKIKHYLDEKPWKVLAGTENSIGCEEEYGALRHFVQCNLLRCSLNTLSSESIAWSVNKARRFLQTAPFFQHAVLDRYMAYSEAIRLCVIHVNVTVKTFQSCASVISKVDRRFEYFYRGMTCLHLAHKLRVVEAVADREDIVDVLAAVVGFSIRSDADNCAAFANAVRVSWRVSSSDTIEFYLCEEYLTRRHGNCSCSRYLTGLYLALLYFNTGLYRSCSDLCTTVISQLCGSGHCKCPTQYVDARRIQIRKLDIICNVIGLLEIYQQLMCRLYVGFRCQSQFFNVDLFFHCLRIVCLRKYLPDTAVEFIQALGEYESCFTQPYNAPLVGDILLYVQCIEYCKFSEDISSFQLSASLPAAVSREDNSRHITSLPTLLIKHASAMLTKTLESFRVEIGPKSVYIIFPSIMQSVTLYKFGSYKQCLQLCRETLRGLNPFIHCCFMRHMTDPPYTELLDDEIASVVGLAMIVNPEMRCSIRENFGLTGICQHLLARYLLVQCMMKLDCSVADVRSQLQQLKLALTVKCECHETIGRLLVCFIYRKTIQYVSRGRQKPN